MQPTPTTAYAPQQPTQPSQQQPPQQSQPQPQSQSQPPSSLPTFSLSSQQQKQLIENCDEFLKQISFIRSNVSDFYNSLINDVKNSNTSLGTNTRIDKEEITQNIKESKEQLAVAFDKADLLSKKLSPYLISINSTLFAVLEQTWAYTTGILDQQNISIHTQLRNENHWRYDTSQKANSVLNDLEYQLQSEFPNLFKENEENTSLKKRKQPSITLPNNVTSPQDSLFKLPLLPPPQQSQPFDYFINLDRIIQSQVNESALEIQKVQSKLQNNNLSPKGVFVECPDVFKCLIYFGIPEDNKSCFTIERITVFGFKESFDSFFVSSKYNIFKKISENAFEAITYYTSNSNGSILKNLLSWLWSFRGLFLEECKGCMNILKLDSSLYMYLPPSFRTYDNLTPYHPQCYYNSHQHD